MNKFCILLILILLGCSSSSENALSINALFSDNMIVQQNAKLNIWGKAPQGSLIHVSSSWGEEASTTTTPDGKWILTIATPEVDHKPHQLMVSSENETIKIKKQERTLLMSLMLDYFNYHAHIDKSEIKSLKVIYSLYD